MLKAIGGIALGAAALLAAGCGGGGGDSTGAPSGTSPPPPPAERVAFALSEIMVVSQTLADRPPFGDRRATTTCWRDNAFGDFRTLIEDVTLHPAMGVYLSMLGNQKPDTARNIRPDENYARELMQLFTIGLCELEPRRHAARDAQRSADRRPTTRPIVEGFAHVFTGWTWAGAASFVDRASARTRTRSCRCRRTPSSTHRARSTLLEYPGARKPRHSGRPDPDAGSRGRARQHRSTIPTSARSSPSS